MTARSDDEGDLLDKRGGGIDHQHIPRGCVLVAAAQRYHLELEASPAAIFPLAAYVPRRSG